MHGKLKWNGTGHMLILKVSLPDLLIECYYNVFSLAGLCCNCSRVLRHSVTC